MIKESRKLLAYLLRATCHRFDAERLGKHRWQNRTTEVTNALVPLVVSERTNLGFFRAFCQRFLVDAAEGPLESRGERWDHVLTKIPNKELRLIVHESPAFLATFAFAEPCEGEDEDFDAFPDPIREGSYVPRLPGRLISPAAYRTVWTLTAPFAHGGDEKSGNVTVFRRQRITDMLTGQDADVPFVSGNAVRGAWRDLVMGRWLTLLGLHATDLPSSRSHALFSGGAVEAGADSADVNLPVRRRARELCPPWDLLAGTTDQQIMDGRLRVHDATLVCRQNAWLVHEVLAPETPLADFAASLPDAVECTQMRMATRHAHKEFEDADGQQMIFHTEVLKPGTQLLHSVQVYGVDGVSEVTLSCLADLLRYFREVSAVGAGNARGLGQIAFDPYAAAGAPPLPDPEVYRTYVAEHADAMRAWALRQDEPPAKKRTKK